MPWQAPDKTGCILFWCDAYELAPSETRSAAQWQLAKHTSHAFHKHNVLCALAHFAATAVQLSHQSRNKAVHQSKSPDKPGHRAKRRGSKSAPCVPKSDYPAFQYTRCV